MGMEKPSPAKCPKSGPSLNCHLPGWMVYSAFHHCWQYRLFLCNIKPQGFIQIHFTKANCPRILQSSLFATWLWGSVATVADLGGFKYLYLLRFTFTCLLIHQILLETVTSIQVFEQWNQQCATWWTAHEANSKLMLFPCSVLCVCDHCPLQLSCTFSLDQKRWFLTYSMSVLCSIFGYFLILSVLSLTNIDSVTLQRV